MIGTAQLLRPAAQLLQRSAVLSAQGWRLVAGGANPWIDVGIMPAKEIGTWLGFE